MDFNWEQYRITSLDSDLSSPTAEGTAVTLKQKEQIRVQEPSGWARTIKTRPDAHLSHKDKPEDGAQQNIAPRIEQTHTSRSWECSQEPIYLEFTIFISSFIMIPNPSATARLAFQWFDLLMVKLIDNESSFVRSKKSQSISSLTSLHF